MKRVTVLLASSLVTAAPGWAHTYTFSPTLLEESGGTVDMTLLNQGGEPPGTYPVDIVLNGDNVDSRDVVFTSEKDEQGNAQLHPCLSTEWLSLHGVRVESYPALSPAGADKPCTRLSAIPQAKAEFRFSTQQLLLSIPQVAMQPAETGLAPRMQWDDGIPALLLNYSADVQHTRDTGAGTGNADAAYVQLNPGGNLGAWRFRNQTRWSRQGDEPGKWQTAYTWAERGLYDMQSRLTLGDRSTPGDVFDSLPFRGVMLGTDENMVAYNQREYAPVIQGIARTLARVDVKQNGYTLYSTTVAPGPFSLSSPGAVSGGNLDVTVWETDGSPQHFVVAYQTPAIALHEGYLKYNLMSGRYRPDNHGPGNDVDQVTLMYGLPWGVTAYTGWQGAEHYRAAALGLGFSLGSAGALSGDVTREHAQRRGEPMTTGQARRLRYSNDVAITHTALTLTYTRYSASGFDALATVLDAWQDEGHRAEDDDEARRKSSTALQLSQPLGRGGSLSLNASREEYRDRAGRDESYGGSYTLDVHNVSVTLGWSQSHGAGREKDSMTSLLVSVPLDSVGEDVSATYQLMSPSQGGNTHEVGLNGRAADSQLYWDVRQQYQTGASDEDPGNSALQLSWDGRYGQVGTRYSYSPHQRQTGASVAGGVIVHQHGITPGQSLGETVALVEAPGAADVPVGSWPGVRTDERGYTTLSGLAPYQENIVSLDPAELPADTDIPRTDVKTVPTQGAVVPAVFRTRPGARSLMTLTRPDGTEVPFGAVVVTGGENTGSGVVSDKGQVYLTGLQPEGSLRVRWGAQAQQQCESHYRLPATSGAAGVYSLSAVCR